MSEGLVVLLTVMLQSPEVVAAAVTLSKPRGSGSMTIMFVPLAIGAEPTSLSTVSV